jgi:hypothetical protein
MSEIQTLGRNDALSKSKRFRADMLGDPTRIRRLDSGATKRIYNGNLGVGATTLYSCPNWKRALANGGLYLIHNPTGGAIAFDFHHVPSGGSVGNSNKIASLTVASLETRSVIGWYMPHVVMKGDSLIINPGTAGLNAWAIIQEIKEEAAAFIGGFAGNVAAATDVTAVTCPALRSLVVLNVVGHNYNAGNADVSANARESGVAAGSTNQFYKQNTVGTGVEFEGPTAGGVTAADGHISIGQGGVVSVRSSVTNVNFWVNSILL